MGPKVGQQFADLFLSRSTQAEGTAATATRAWPFETMPNTQGVVE